jgi:uncharacterized protein YybS (DUF2232 family)
MAAVWTALKDPALHRGAGMAVGFFLAINLIPVFGVVLGVLTPVPLVYHYHTRGRVFGLTMIGLAALVILAGFSFLGDPSAAVVFLAFAAVAIGLGEALGRGWSVTWVVGIPAGLVVALNVAALLALSMGSGHSPRDVIRLSIEVQIRQAVQMSRAISEGQPLPDPGPVPGPGTESGAGPDALRDQDSRGRDVPSRPAPPPDPEVEIITRWLLRLAPGLMILTSVIVSWANFLLLRPFLARKGFLSPHLADLTGWQAPEKLIWVVIAAGFGVWWADGAWSAAAINVLMISGLIYFFQGLAVTAQWLARKRVPPAIRAVIYTLIALQLVLALAIALLGLFDLWMDFRKLKNAGSAGPA